MDQVAAPVAPHVLMTTLVEAGSPVLSFAGGPMVHAVDRELIRAEFYKQYSADDMAKCPAHAPWRAVRRWESHMPIRPEWFSATLLELAFLMAS